jgi:hypothetical protein
MAASQLVATTAFAAHVYGETVVVHEGDVYASTHPIVKAHKELFAPGGVQTAAVTQGRLAWSRTT